MNNLRFRLPKKSPVWTAILAVAILYIPLFVPAQPWPAPYRQGQRWGYVHPETGKIIVPPTLDSVGTFKSDDVSIPLAWVKKGGRYGLVNRLGELVLPIEEIIPLIITPVAKGFFAVERFAFDARSAEEEEVKLSELFQEFIPRPIAFFDENGRAVGKPFAFQTNSYLGEGGKWEDPNGFDTDIDSSYWLGKPLQEIWKDGKVGLFDLKKGKILAPPSWNYISIHHRIAIGRRWAGGGDDFRRKEQAALIDLATGSTVLLPDSIEPSYEHGLGQSGLILAKNRNTERWGFLDKTGQIVIPFRFLRAHPFSKNGRTKVVCTDQLWYIIDRSGREMMQLGKSSGYQPGADGSIWLSGDADRLYRKKDAAKEDVIGQMGFDYPPKQVKFGTQLLWQGERFRKTGLLDSTGRVVLPLEFDYLRLGFYPVGLSQDSIWQEQLFTVRKNQRTWLFYRQNLQHVWPTLQPGSGLVLGASFEKSNFSLLSAIAGDSLFVVELPNKKQDILNIRSGRCWGLSNVNYFSIFLDCVHGPLIHAYSQVNGEFLSQRFKLNGQPIPWTREIYSQHRPGFEGWTAGYDAATCLTTVFDSTGRTVCQFHNPFAEADSRISIDVNEGGKLYPYVFSVVSYRGEYAVFLPDGRLVTPPHNREVEVYRDLIQVSCDSVPFSSRDILGTRYRKRGLYRIDGTEVFPCLDNWISVMDDNILVYTTDQLIYRYNLQGKMLGLYPPGYHINGGFINGLQPVYSGRNANYVDEQLKLLFPADHLIKAQPFSEGLGLVKMPSGWKYITPTGKPALDEIFVYAESFLNGRAIVRTKDGWTKVIDPQGNTLFQVTSGTDANVQVLSRLGKSFIVWDSLGKRLLSLNGELMLSNLCIADGPQGDVIPFSSGDRLGYLLPEGQIKWVETSDFVLDNHPERGARYILKNFGCPVEGLLNPATREWIVAPKMYQSIIAYDDLAPFAFVYDKKNGQYPTLVHRHTGDRIPVEPGYLQLLEGKLGWLLRNPETETSWLYSHDFKSKRPWNYQYRIGWKEEEGLFQVSDMDSNIVGYISKNGRVLFED